LRGFKIARSCAPLNHLLFADDLVIFTTATSSEASLIKSYLDKYGLWLGQMVNIQKSHILFSKNTAPATISTIQAILPYARTPVSARHLGLPLLIGHSKSAAFSDILDKVQGKIEGWRSKTLSQAGKTVLVKVVASTIHSYAMSSFLLPKGFCRTLDKAFKNFGGVSTRINLAISPLNLGVLYVYQKIKVDWVFALCEMLICLSFRSLVGICSLTTPAPGSLFSRKSTSNMVISYLPLLPQVPGFGMASKQLFPSLLKVLVSSLANSLLYLFGLLPGFLLFLPFSLIPVCLICPPFILCLSLIFFSLPLPIGIPHCYFFFLNLQPLLKY
jgi:hypothetical protein